MLILKTREDLPFKLGLGFPPSTPPLKERFNYMQQGESLISVVSELAIKSGSKLLYAEDLKDIGELIKQALSKGINSMENVLDMWHRYHVLRELLQSVVQTLSNLLEDKQKPAWNDLDEFQRRAVLSSLLEELEESALFLAEASNHDGSFSLVKNNVLLSVQVLDHKDSSSIQFPLFHTEADIDWLYWTAMQDRLLLPSQVLKQYSRRGTIKIIFAAFNNAGNVLKPGAHILHYPYDISSENVTRIINSRIIAASLERAGSSRLLQPVTITLKHLEEDATANPICVFWDYHSRDWSARGCWLELSNQTHTTCACDHLTNFAVVMELKTSMEPNADIASLQLIVYVGCIIASVCLFLTFLAFCTLRVTGDNIIIRKHMFLCLFLSEVLFSGGIHQTKPFIACALIAATLQYLFLASFLWMFLECFQRYLMVTGYCSAEKSNAYWYYAAAYVTPIVIIGASAAIDSPSYRVEKYCWLQANNYLFLSFIGPIVGIVLAAVIFFFLTIYVFCRRTTVSTVIKEMEGTTYTNFKSWNWHSILLFCLVMFTWTAGWLYINKETIFFASAFSSLNCVQGTTIICLYCFRNERINEARQRLLERQGLFKSCYQPAESNCADRAGNVEIQQSERVGAENIVWNQQQIAQILRKNGPLEHRIMQV